MNQYLMILAIIVALALINLGTLVWVALLRRKNIHLTKVIANEKHLAATEEEAERVIVAQSLQLVEQSVTAKLTVVLDEMVAALQRDLTNASKNLTQHVSQVGTQAIDAKLQALEKALSDIEANTTNNLGAKLLEADKTLSQLEVSATASLQQIQALIEKKKQSLETAMGADLNQEKARIMKQFDERLADVVGNYLIEVLGQQVDLGAQSKFLFAQLEAHKAELKQEIDHELGAA
jgi:hypothetical protein